MMKVIMKIVGAVLALIGMIGFAFKSSPVGIIGSYVPAAGKLFTFIVRNYVVLLGGSAIGLVTGICWENE